ncbi:pwwp domain-containing [Trichoderma arundinaceum]|uniref:Pwwp domain-containing n=1 Tax=Trichoderma arundinaceum TaxID=490622 RepID=A0A395NV19_TRIAR|nr:pwwp domain-containing [Trichoderma arundinaceum]
MADNSPEKPEAAAPVASTEEVSAAGSKAAGEGELAAKTVDKSEGDATMEDAKDAEEPKAPESAAEAAPAKPAEDEKKTDTDGDAEMKDAADTAAEHEADTTAAADTPAAKGKNRRKSTAGESKGKTLSKKGSKARLTHIDAQPGDHFLVKLKGFPAWPAIICDEDMLPQALINTRPVSAARPDGSYSEAYADGGKRVHDRSFPVMYLYTNEFGWVANTALSELTADKARETIGDKMRKDLKAAFELAIEQNSVEHYKDILQSFQDELIAQEEARKEAAATPKKGKKGKAKASDDDEDVDMEDVEEAPKSKPKKRKATDEDTAVPQRSESVKKPKIKLNTSSTSKAANGTAAPKAKEEKAAKAAKAKPKKGADKKSDAPKEPKMTPEERHAQRGFPREDEMESMASFIKILENFQDLEVSIIRGTKINKVLKAILKLDSIPREEDFNFKKRSQALLDKWNKLLTSDGTVASTDTANGVNGASEPKDSGKPAGNSGVKEGSDKDKEAEDEKTKADTEEAVATATAKDEEPKPEEDVSEKEDKKTETEAAPVSAAVEAAA